MQMTIIVFKLCVFEDVILCKLRCVGLCIQDDRFCGDHLLKISREIFINAIPTREFGQFKVDSCDSCVIWRKKDATEEVAYMINCMEYNTLGKQNISLLIR